MLTAHNTTKIACLVLLAAYSLCAEASVAGRFQFVSGDVKVVAVDGKERPALKGQEVDEGDTVVTMPEASAQLKMIDGGLIAVRPGTQVKMTAYVFNGVEDGKENVLLSLARGGFRTITGLVGKTNKQQYKVVTPTATVGIRGTDHEPVFVLPPLPGIPATTPPGTYDKVNFGMTSLTTEVGTALIARNQVGYAAAPNQAPVILPKLPDIYLQATPAPRAAKEQQKSDKAQGDGKQAAAGQASGKQESGDAGSADSVRTSSADAAQLATAPSLAAIAPMSVAPPTTPLTGTDASGSTLNTSNPLPSVTPPVTRTYTPGPAVLVVHPETPLLDTLTLANVNSGLASAQTALSSAQTLLASGNSAVSAANTALTAAKSAVDAGQAAYDLAIAAGAPSTDPILVSALNALHSGRQALTDGLNAYDGSGTGSAGSTGAVPVMSLADKALQAGSRLIKSVQAWLAANNATTRQDVDFGRQSLNYLVNQVNLTGSSAANSASTAAQNALSAAISAQAAASQAAASLASLSVTAPGYAGLKAASDAATAAANAARGAADAAVAAANASLAANTNGQQLTASLGQGNSWFYTSPYSTWSHLAGGNVTASRDAAGQLTGVERNWGVSGSYYSYEKIAQVGSTLTDFTQHAATGLAWGRWQGGKVSTESQYFDKDASGKWGLGNYDPASGQFVIGATYKNTTDLGQASLHWITGTEAQPGRLPQILTGTATYSLVGGTKPTDSFGNVGTLNSARLDVNFTAQTVNAGVDFSVAGVNWALQGKALPLYGGDSFYGYSCIGCTTKNLDVLDTFTRNGVPVATSTGGNSAYASLTGSLLGSGLNSAAMQYSVDDWISTAKADSITGQSFTINDKNIIQGVVGFSGVAQNPATPYRGVAIVDGSGGAFGNVTDIGLAGGGWYPGHFEGDVGPASRVVDSAAGLTEFVGWAWDYTPAGTAAASTFAQYASATIKVGSAANKDVGATLIDGTTISWGRWENGVIDIYSRDGSTKLGTVDNANRSIHWLATSTLTDALVSLPLTGTATYTLVGNTSPTDFKGNLGTLGSAKLDADFANLKVNASVTVSFSAATNTSSWSMSAGNIPIGKHNGNFESGTPLNGVNGVSHTVTCSGASCGAQSVGGLSGAFIGNGAAGAAFAYSMATGASTTTAGVTTFNPINAVTGMAVFKK